jgi:hypothetical protein
MLHQWLLYFEGIAGEILVWLEHTPCLADLIAGLRIVLDWVH